MAKIPQQFYMVPIEGAVSEELSKDVDTIAEVSINRDHIVSAQFNIADASLLICTSTSIGYGKTTYRWEQATKLQLDPKSKRMQVVPEKNKGVEKSYDEYSHEPASITVTNKEAIINFMKWLHPELEFDGFEKHEKLKDKLDALMKAKLEEEANAKLNLTKPDGSPLNKETVNEVPPILDMNGDIANETL